MSDSEPSRPCHDVCPGVDEDDVARLNLKEVRNVLSRMGLSMKGLQDLKEAQLFLKTEIIKRKTSRSTQARRPAAILRIIKEEHRRKCNLLIKLMDAIETKIERVPEDSPLWKQLDIICKDYKENFESERKELNETLCKLLVAGETCAGKTSVINNLLGKVVLPESFLCNTQALSEICYGDENHAVAYPWNEDQDNCEPPFEILPEEGKDFLEVIGEKIEARKDITSHGDFKRIDIQLKNEFLRESEVTIVDTPGIGDNTKTSTHVFEHLKDAFVFLFVLNTENRGGVQDRIRNLAKGVNDIKIDDSQFLRPESVIFLGNKFDKIPPSDYGRIREYISEKLSQYWPGFRSEQFIPYCAKDTASVLDAGYMTRPYCQLLNGFEKLIPVGSDNKLRMKYYWIANMLRKIICALDVHVNNRESDRKKKERDFRDAIKRLSELEAVSLRDMKGFKKTLDRVVDDLVKQLKEYILSDSMLKKLTHWDVSEFYLIKDWQEMEKYLYKRLTLRLDDLMHRWDMEEHVFQKAMAKFQREVEERVAVIGREIENLMKFVSNQDEESRQPEDEGAFGWLHPFLTSMTTFQRAFFGYSAGVLFPVFAVVAVSAFIYLSSIKLRDVIRGYFRGHEFNDFRHQPVRYLKKYSEKLIVEYCNSRRGLRAQVQKMMGPWQELIEKLTEIVPQQINKDRDMIKTYISEERTDARLNEEYAWRRKGFGAVQKALRHFETFNLKRVSKDVPMFDVDDVAYYESKQYRVCEGLCADVYHAMMCVVPPASSAAEVAALIQHGEKMMKENLQSIVEMHDEQQTAQHGSGSNLDEGSASGSTPSVDELSKRRDSDIERRDSDIDDSIMSEAMSDFFSALKVEIERLNKEKQTADDDSATVGSEDSEKRAKRAVEGAAVHENQRLRSCSLPNNLRHLEDKGIVKDVLSRMSCVAAGGCPSDAGSQSESLLMPGKMGQFSIRRIKPVILEKDIFRYLNEEQCYCHHECRNLVKFEGTCIRRGQIFHKLEPLKCNLRQFIAATDLRDSSDTKKYEMIKGWLQSILNGLVYLHAIGLTALDLSMDTIAVDVHEVVKLTNISSPKDILDSIKLQSMTEEDLWKHRYVALEVFEQGPGKGKYTSKSDMYAFGLLIWEILSGKLVFEDDFNRRKDGLKTSQQFMEFIRLRRPVLPISQLCLLDSDFVKHLTHIQELCWKYEPDERMKSGDCVGLLNVDPRPPPLPVNRF